MRPLRRWFRIGSWLLLFALSACGNGTDNASSVAEPTSSVAEVPTRIATAAVPTGAAAAAATPAVTTTEPTATATAVPPTPTPTEPLAALVNEEPIYLSTYEKELARYEQAYVELGQEPPPDYREVVLDELIGRALIVQFALAEGVVITPEMVDERLAELRAEVHEEANFEAWLEANQFTEDEFREALKAEILVTEMRDRVTADVPFAVEQVHARYIQVEDAELAASLREQIVNGSDFGLLAAQYSLDQISAQEQGELGFFPRGGLSVPELEELAFSLDPGQLSEVLTVTNADGSQTHYLLEVLEKDPQRPLSSGMRYNLLKQTFEAWLEEQWEQATIERFVDTGA